MELLVFHSCLNRNEYYLTICNELDFYPSFQLKLIKILISLLKHLFTAKDNLSQIKVPRPIYGIIKLNFSVIIRNSLRLLELQTGSLNQELDIQICRMRWNGNIRYSICVKSEDRFWSLFIILLDDVLVFIIWGLCPVWRKREGTKRS